MAVRCKQPRDARTPPEYHDVILDSIADGVFTVDGGWTITSFNKAAEKITGVPGATLEKKHALS